MIHSPYVIGRFVKRIRFLIEMIGGRREQGKLRLAKESFFGRFTKRLCGLGRGDWVERRGRLYCRWRRMNGVRTLFVCWCGGWRGWLDWEGRVNEAVGNSHYPRLDIKVIIVDRTCCWLEWLFQQPHRPAIFWSIVEVQVETWNVL